MKRRNNILKYIGIIICLVAMTFSTNFLFDNRIYAANDQEKTGKSVNDATGLGENTLSETTGPLATLGVLGGGGTEGGDEATEKYEKFNRALYKVWGVILVVLQVASMTGIIFAGVRYMFASADAKADLKKSMIYLVIGMIIVFGASSVVGFVTGTFNEMVAPFFEK